MSPALLAVAVLVVLVAGTYFLLGRDRAGQSTRQRNRAPLHRRTPAWLRVLPFVLLLGSAGCLVVALLQFRSSHGSEHVTVMLAMDTSNSMEATDVQPNRLAAASNAARAFLAQMPAEFRVGLITFAARATLNAEPTVDREPVSQALAGVRTERGTTIGDGLTLALDTIQDEGSGPGAVLLLSDGRDTGSEVTPLQAAQRAGELGVPVYTVTLGQAGEGGGAGANLTLLQEVADTTGAQAYTAATAGELTQIYEDLGSRLSTELEIGDLAQLFVIAAVVLAIAAGIAVLAGSRGQY
jgi:Ca-activated chloride channel family protein